MSHRFISQLADRESVNEVYQAWDKKLRPNRNGNLYLQFTLTDRTGSLHTLIWNASDHIYQSFENGDFLRVEGTAQLYQGEMQLIATKISKVPAQSVQQEDFQLQSPQQIEQATAKLTKLLRSMNNEALLNLAEVYLMDEEFMRKFSHVPAGIKHHHAYIGGLLDHTIQMMTIADRITDLYPSINRDLLLMGTFLHDSGKIEELTFERGFTYTDVGQLIGHLVIAVGTLERKAQEVEKLAGDPFPDELLLQLKHLLVSHHGEYEYGSPKLPMTLEAVALWQIDNLDSRLHHFEQLMQDDPNVESDWTLYHQPIGRKLYKKNLNEQ